MHRCSCAIRNLPEPPGPGAARAILTTIEAVKIASGAHGAPFRTSAAAVSGVRRRQQVGPLGRCRVTACSGVVPSGGVPCERSVLRRAVPGHIS